ncbi:MAG: N-acetylglucosamine-6-phosphate deacetylase [Verrucomicrobiota bacterium]
MGYFDLQINGYAGVDFNADLVTDEEISQVCEALRNDGIDRFLITLITDSIERLCQKLARLRALCAADELARSMVAGFHVEGPFINPMPGYVGAHPPERVTPATPQLAERLIEAADGWLRLMTLAPECDAEMKTIAALRQAQVTVSAGHCNPDLETLDQAIESGLSMVTHLGNGCPVELNRHDNFIQRVLSRRDDLWICLIPDGKHIPFYALRNYLDLIGPERWIATTDAIAAAGLGPGTYSLSGFDVIVDAEGYARRPGSPNLAGSTVRGHDLVGALRECGLSSAVIDLVYRANVATALNLAD